MDEIGIIKQGLNELGLMDGDVKIRHHSSSLFPLYRADDGGRTLAVKAMRSIHMARSEGNGLRALREAGALAPEVFGVFEANGRALLVMEFLEHGSSGNSRESLKSSLKALYGVERETWGWDEDNFIGTLPQKNGTYATFSEFWWKDRILAQLEMAVGKRLLNQKHIDQAKDVVFRKCADWKLDEQTPRLIHGDLWGGNVLAAKRGMVLIDPSVARSNPEQDLGMLALFGNPLGFEDMEELSAFAGMPGGLSERISFWQLYPLLVHVNIFGGSYVSSTERVLRTYRA